MKYVIGMLIFLIACIAAGWKIAQLICRRHKTGIVVRTLLTAAISTVLVAASGFAYLEVYYHAGTDAETYLKSSDSVIVSEDRDAFVFDGPGTKQAVIFFSGAKVEETAYAPLMFRLAEQGVDCFLLKLPFRIALMASGAPGKVMSENSYDSWYIMGHSLGGTAAAKWCSENPVSADGLILLAAYPAAPVPDQLRMLSIYGTSDGCLNRAEYKAGKSYWPDIWSESVIDGGNHSGFADYGPQRGDGEASISPYEQQSETAYEIRRFTEGDR